MRFTCFTLTSIGLAGSVSAAADGATLQVPGGYPTIQAAINAASDGDEIIVAPGTYTGTGNTNIKTLGKKITVRSATGAAHCTIEGRGFEFWAGDSADTVIEGFTIRLAVSGPLGAAVSIFNASPTIRHCVITDCYTPSNGAGMWIWGPTSLPLIEDCVFANNCTFGFGGAVAIFAAKPTIRHCIFSANFSAVENGWTGPGSNNISSDPQFMPLASGTWTLAPFYETGANFTVYTDADAAFVPGALVGRAMNPEISQQRRQYIAANTATTISVHGDFTPGDAPACVSNNLPVEVNDHYAIFAARPIAGSPVIDAGNNAALPRGVLVDLDAQARFVDDPEVTDTGLGRAPLVDMGAFERQSPSTADVNGDGVVNSTDLGMLLGAWGTSDPMADLDGDGVVGASDLGILPGAWTTLR